MPKDTKIAIFKGRRIRKTLHNNEWWFVIVDVIAALTDSSRPDGYLKDMRRRDPELAKGWGQIATPLLVETEGGKQKINCANTEGIFRIIQSIPSSKAEPFKRWLAKVGGITAGNARKALEKRLKRPIVTEHNYLKERESKK